MRKFGILLLALFIALPLHAETNGDFEKITDYKTTIFVNKDSSIRVEEDITYDFGSAERHGIYRDIPADIRDVSVVDEKGAPYPFSLSKSDGQEEIKIGDANKLITGTHIYKITYSVRYAVSHYKDYDEIYWNTTGNAWNVQIQSAEAFVVLPEPIDVPALRIACYFGPQGSTSRCGGAPTLMGSQASQVTFQHEGELGAYEGMTVAVGFPKGVVEEPSTGQKILNFLLDNPMVFLPPLTFFFMFTLWWKKGRDPKGSGVIVAEYDAPDNLTPLEVAGVLDTTIPGRALSSEIIYLATQGYLKIERVEEKKLFIKETDYKLTLLKDYANVGNAFDLGLLQALFADGSAGAEVRLSDLKNKFYTHVPGIKRAVFQSVTDKQYYVSRPDMVTSKYGGWLFVLVVIMGGLVFATKSPISLISVLISTIIAVFFIVHMPSKTNKGAFAKDKILGLKEYLQIAEKDRLEFHNAPEKKPEIFEKLLPYAMVLGVEKAWAKEFADIYTTPPSWYNDPYSTGAFNASIFTQSLGHFSSAATTSLSSSPGGGSGGGGFSGGGGGGGGGGSW